MSTTTYRTSSSVGTRPRRALVIVGGIVIAAVFNVLIAVIAPAAGVDSRFPALAPAGVIAFTLGGALIATLGWWLIVRFVLRSRRALTVLVPVLFVLTAIPDVLIMASTLPIPYGGTAAGIALLLMHVVVVGVMVSALAKVFPAR